MFTVGPSGSSKDFRVFVDAIARTPPVFDRMINGSMLEATTRHASIDDFQPLIFDLFLEFAYFGDYPEPSEAIDYSKYCTSEPHATQRDVEQEARKLQIAAIPLVPEPSAAQKAIAEIRRGLLTECPVLSKYEACYSDELRCHHERSPLWGEDIGTVLLQHVELYKFADKYQVTKLSSLILHRVLLKLRDLTNFGFGQFPRPSSVPSGQNVSLLPAILDLVEYVFDEDNFCNPSGSFNPLRVLVVRFVVANVGRIGWTQEFYELLALGGPFPSMFWLAMKESLNVKNESHQAFRVDKCGTQSNGEDFPSSSDVITSDGPW